MSPLRIQQRKIQEKIRLDILSLIQHYKPEHCLVGVLTLRGHYPLPKINRMWTHFVRNLRPQVLAYYAVVDISQTPHIHYVLAVEENIQENICMEDLAFHMEVQNRRKSGGVFPDELRIAKQLLSCCRGNAALQAYKRLVRAFKTEAGFGPVMDLWPIYTIPEAVAAYHARAHANSSRYKNRQRSLKKHKIVHTSRGLPDGILHSLDSFTLVTKWTSRYRNTLTRVATAFGVGAGDTDTLMRIVGARNSRALTQMAFRLLNRIPGDPRRWRLDGVREHVMDLFPGMVRQQTPLEVPTVPAGFLHARAAPRSGTALGAPATA